MEKLVYLLGDAPPGTVPAGRDDLCDAILAAAPALREAGARDLSFQVANVDEPELGRLYQANTTGLMDGQLSVWVDALDGRGAIEEIVSGLAARNAGYLVTESILREYPRHDWAVGEPSPCIALFTAFPRPEALARETFYARWHGSHGPLSLLLHPLLRYMRNAVFRPITEGAPRLDAIVSESVLSCAVAADVDQFYGGPENQKLITKDLLSFVEMRDVSTVIMREYLL